MICPNIQIETLPFKQRKSGKQRNNLAEEDSALAKSDQSLVNVIKRSAKTLNGQA